MRGQLTTPKKLDEPAGMSTDESLIVFACTDGTGASEISSERNGRFTKCLLRHIEKLNTPVHTMLTDVIGDVKKESNRSQIPKIYTSLSYSDIYLTEDIPGKLRIFLFYEFLTIFVDNPQQPLTTEGKFKILLIYN